MLELLEKLVQSIGLLHLTVGHIAMIVIGGVMIYLSIKRGMEPYELLPIGFGIILANLPLTRMMPENLEALGGTQVTSILGVIFHYTLYRWNILPPLIFLCIGAMIDFGPLIANPKTLLLGAAAQIGVFISFFLALAVFGFTIPQACSIGIIGGADGPTTIYTTAILASDLLPATAAAAYIYIATVAFIQPPIMRLLTTKKERRIVMKQLRRVSKTEKILFPVLATVIIILLVPLAAPLVGMLLFGNLLKESGVVGKLSNAAQNELMSIVTIMLMLCVGASMSAERMIQPQTLTILGLGLVAFAGGTAGGVLLAKLMNLFCKDKVNPLIGSAGVSAVPMSARISQIMGQKENPQNYLLMHAMGPNVAGVIGSAVAAGVFIYLAK